MPTPSLTLHDQNREREHAPHGWYRTSEARVARAPRAGTELVRCPCGWLGWIATEIARKLEVRDPSPADRRATAERA